jgi:hypothetical protein
MVGPGRAKFGLKMVPRPGPSYSSGRISRPRPSPLVTQGAAQPGNFGPGRAGPFGPGCPWPDMVATQIFFSAWGCHRDFRMFFCMVITGFFFFAVTTEIFSVCKYCCN